jgi:hypothetical protein
MSVIEKVTSFLTGGGRTGEPVGTIHVVDPSPLNWLYITYNTVEELVRVNTDGAVEPAAMKSYSWADDRTLEIEVREGEVFPRAIALKSLSKNEVSEIRVIPASFETFVVNPEFGARVLA